MKLRRARLGVLLAAVAGMVVVAVPPAQATTVQASVFVGTLYQSGSLRNLGPAVATCATTTNPLDCVTVTTGPGGTEVTVAGGANTVAFVFSSGVCFRLTASTPGSPSPTGVAQCRVTATGVVTGFNGVATGVGTFSSQDLSGVSPTFTTGFTFTQVGDVLTLVGDANEAAFVAVLAKQPDPEPEPKEEEPPPPPPSQTSGLSGNGG